MSRQFFGTDGIRGLANTPPVDCEHAMRAGMAAGAYFHNENGTGRVVIGKDTRLSSYMIENALTAGFLSMGMHVMLLGPMSTPGVSMITRSLRADLGVMISASHNPYHDNGIKFFTPNGLKLSDDVEEELEALMKGDMTPHLAPSEKLGRAKRIDDAYGRYVEYVKYTFPKKLRLDGVKIVIDCANGAAYKLAPAILQELGAEIVPIGISPNGFNINEECGSTKPKKLCQKVKSSGADIGIALDGDADRLVVCDEKGKIIDGDIILGMIATYWQEQGRLTGNGIVATIMSNLALERYLNDHKLKLHRTQVGDRYVAEMMRKKNINFGGENSGHIIFNDYTTTGDGCIAALQLLAILVEKQCTVSKLFNIFKPLTQISSSVKYTKRNTDILDNKSVQKSIKAAEKKLGKKGRLIIRKSGTEPVIRIMAEGENDDLLKTLTQTIADEIRSQQKAA